MKKVFTIFALVVMFFFCGSILLRFTVKNALIDNGVENKWTDIVFFDAKETDKETNDGDKVSLSDFNEAVKEKLPLKAEQKIFKYEDNGNSSKKQDNFYSRIKKKINYYTTEFLVFNKVIAKIGFFLNYHFFCNKILPDGRINLGDGYLANPILRNSFKKIDVFVQKVGYFKHILDSIGIPLVYAQYPSVMCDEDNFENQAKLRLAEKLSQIGVPVIDLTKECRHSLFYKTDVHWQAKTSIWAGQEISKKLNELYGFDLNVELLDTNNFTEKLATKWVRNREKENFYIYSPKYTTDINWLLFNGKKLFQSSGSFDSLYHFVSDENKVSYAYTDAYTSYSFSQNNNLPDGKKILIIGDSFNNPLSKFLTLVFKEVYFIFYGSSLLDDYLVNKPDVVVLGFSKYGFVDPENLIF
ncbi:MAG: hypothetical protein LBC87_06715 [Fibromonadaceae bacterium]|jgi:hypothetical protein|nr:hypothetical protein [Fibromonadaceae bacterium]